MAYESAKLFKELLESKGMHPSFADDKESVVRIGFKLKNTSMDLFFSFGESNQDVHIQLDSCADETFLLMHRMINIIDEAYPVFMKAMWS